MSSTTATRKPTHVQVTFRSMKFDFDSGFRADWHGGSPFISHFWSALSQALPPGEKFFIDSLRAIRERVDDPELLDEIEQLFGALRVALFHGGQQYRGVTHIRERGLQGGREWH